MDVIISLLMLLAVWQLIVWVTGVPSFILPGPAAVAGALVGNFGLILEHASATAIEVLLGMVVLLFARNLLGFFLMDYTPSLSDSI